MNKLTIDELNNLLDASYFLNIRAMTKEREGETKEAKRFIKMSECVDKAYLELKELRLQEDDGK